MMSAAPDPRRDLRWAWVLVALTVVAAVLGQLVGYGIAVLLGYPVPEEAEPPLGDALLIAVPALIVMVAPALGALYVGLRAGRGGRSLGYVAAGLGALAVVYWTVVTMMSVIARI